MKLFFPDSLWTPTQISGSSFLYFHKDTICVTLHPSVSSFMSGVNVLSFIEIIKERTPAWKDTFLNFFEMWKKYRVSLVKTQNLIEPLKPNSLKTVLFSYDRGAYALKESEELLQASALKIEGITPLIDPFHACDELYSHLFFEKVLEIRRSQMTEEAYKEFEKNQAKSIDNPEKLIKDFDWNPLYDYCNELFTYNSLPELLTKVYMFRIPYLKTDIPAILLSNRNLIAILSSLPITGAKDERFHKRLDTDVIAWEFFRQLVSPIIDPLDTETVVLINEMIIKRTEEIERLKSKCYELSLELPEINNLDYLSPKIKEIIKAKVENELQDLLKIDNKAFRSFLLNIFSDEKAWISLLSFIHGLSSGGEVFTAGSAIYGLSNIGAKAVSEVAKRNEKLETSSYTLIYRMR